MEQDTALLLRVREEIDCRLEKLLVPSSEPLGQITREIVLSPGKRIRPVIALLVGQSLGGKRDSLIEFGCALEFVHAASLVLDDLPCMDGAMVRRGQPSAHVRYGEAAAILASFALIGHAFHLLSTSEALPPSVRSRLTGLLAQAIGCSGLAGGQHADLYPGNISSERHRLLIRQKTAPLFAAAMEGAAIIAGTTQERKERLVAIGFAIGLAYQLADDIADVPIEFDDETARPDAGGQLSDAGDHRFTLQLIRVLHLCDNEPATRPLVRLLRNVFFPG
jgi:geranylgeranyl diphosphate synthase type II